MFDWVSDLIDYAKGVYNVISAIGKVIWTIITQCIGLIAFVVVVCVELGVWLHDNAAGIRDQIVTAWDVLQNAHNSFTNARSAGWPPQMAECVAYVNGFFPLQEMIVGTTALIHLFLVCMVVRMVKSIIPLFNGG